MRSPRLSWGAIRRPRITKKYPRQAVRLPNMRKTWTTKRLRLLFPRGRIRVCAGATASTPIWPAASMMPFWSITARTAARVPTFRWAARRSSGKVSLPRPTTRRCSRPIRPTGTTCSANILPNIRRLTKHFCRTAKTIRPFSPGKQRPTSMARLFRVIRRQPQLRPMGCRSRG